ncbi:unnamed protein product [Lota lota]
MFGRFVDEEAQGQGADGGTLTSTRQKQLDSITPSTEGSSPALHATTAHHTFCLKSSRCCLVQGQGWSPPDPWSSPLTGRSAMRRCHSALRANNGRNSRLFVWLRTGLSESPEPPRDARQPLTPPRDLSLRCQSGPGWDVLPSPSPPPPCLPQEEE